MKKRGSFFIITGSLFIGAAVLLAGYNFYDNYQAGKNAEDALAQLQSAMLAEPGETKPGAAPKTEPEAPQTEEPQPEETEEPGEPADPAPVRMIAGREYAGILTLKPYNRSLPVLNDWDYDSLKLSPCRYYGSVDDGPLVICAHNYNRHFGSLKALRNGSSVSFEDMSGRVTEYTVVKTETLGPNDVDAMISDEYDLTLFTCTLGGATRTTVRCKLAE